MKCRNMSAVWQALSELDLKMSLTVFESEILDRALDKLSH